MSTLLGLKEAFCLSCDSFTRENADRNRMGSFYDERSHSSHIHISYSAAISPYFSCVAFWRFLRFLCLWSKHFNRKSFTNCKTTDWRKIPKKFETCHTVSTIGIMQQSFNHAIIIFFFGHSLFIWTHFSEKEQETLGIERPYIRP